MARDAFLERIGLTVETADAGHDRCDLSVISSCAHALRQTFDLMGTDSEEDWHDIGTRLAGVPAALDDYRTTLAQEAGLGRVVAKRQYAEIAGQVRRWTGQEGSSGNFFADLVATAPEPQAPELERHATVASASYAEFGRWLETDLTPLGSDREPVGRDRYALASRKFLGARVDLEETYAVGLGGAQADSPTTWPRPRPVVPGGDSPRRSRPSMPTRRASSGAARSSGTGCRIWPTGRSRSWPASTSTSPTRSAGSSVASRRPTTAASTTPAPRKTSPVPAGCGGRSRTASRLHDWREVTTVYHEGVPGHHLQVGQTICNAEALNRWQRLLCWVSGHGEGWALYSERLMEELGYLDDPGNRLGMLDMQGFRAARVVVDIGLHLELEIPRTTRSAGGPARAGRRIWSSSSCGSTRGWTTRAQLRGAALPRLAGPGPVVQGRRADLARGSGRRAGQAR